MSSEKGESGREGGRERERESIMERKERKRRRHAEHRRRERLNYFSNQFPAHDPHTQSTAAASINRITLNNNHNIIKFIPINLIWIQLMQMFEADADFRD